MKPLLLFLLLIAIDLESQPLEWSESGTLRVSNTEWQTLYMNSKWRPHPQSRDLAVQDHSKNRWSGFFRASDQTPLFSYQQTVQGSSDQFQLKASVRAEPNLATNLLSYQGTLPIAYYGGTELLLDSTPLKLPSTFDGDPRITIQQVRKVQIPTPEGTLTLEGNSTLMVVDSRKYGGSEFFLRFFYHPHKGSIHESHFSTKIQFTTHDFTPLSLDSVANRDFADPIAGDGKGGWTDQGPENDLSSFDANSKILGDIPFTVGDRTLILSQKTERSDKAFAELEVSANSPAQYLYLLHASAYTWGKVGQIKVLYRDGSEEQFPLNASMDIGNWWNPTPFENAALGWTGSTSEANVGLYISRFRVQEKPIHSITFSATGEPTWMIVAATLSPTELPLPEPEYFEVQANENWQPIPIPRTVKPGSALDFSSWTQAPAGQHGPVITTKDGHFAFSNDTEQNVRFWGTNLNFDANFLPRSQADALALRFRQIGYNAVRIHHYDVLLANGWNPASYGIDPDRLDQLDYLFYAMKEQGLYISTDLFTIRRIRNPELKDLVGNNHAAFKALVPILPAAMEDWKRFARDLLTHTNPYTGMTWAEDPALFSIAPVNEDTLWAAINSSPAIRRLYEERFEEWLQTHPRPTATGPERAAAFNEFIAGLHIQADRELRHFLREDLGCHALLTGNNWKLYPAQAPIRSQYDYVDNHGYWDHPSFPNGPWNYPFSSSQRSAIQDLANVPRRLFLTRIFGKPFTITEFNYVYPNQYRSEGGGLMGTYASLQDYDGLFRFSWAHSTRVATDTAPAEGFDIAQDPINLLSEHIIGMFWRRGDMPAFAEEAVYQINREGAFSGNRFAQSPPEFPRNASLVGLNKRISSQYVGDTKLPVTVNAEFDKSRPASRYASEIKDSRVVLDQRGDFFAQTPYSQVITIQKESLAPEFVEMVSGGPTTLFAGALDHAPLAESKHILVLHLTDVLSEGMRFAEEERHTLLSKGTATKLVRAGSAEISLPQAGPHSETTIYALALDGSRIAEVPYEISPEGNLRFTAQTLSDNRIPILVYEIVR